jgi:hypothetical protein
MKTEQIVSRPSDLWDRVFRGLDFSDEQAVVRFIRMVVAGQPELPKKEQPCRAFR